MKNSHARASAPAGVPLARRRRGRRRYGQPVKGCGAVLPAARALAVLLCVLLCSSLCGCWNYRELEGISTVTSMSIDLSEDGQWYITAEIVDFSKGETSSSAEASYIAAHGETYFDAIRNMIELSSQKLYWSHALSFIVSRSVAEQGIASLVDWISRNSELRPECAIFVSREDTASDIFDLETPNNKFHGYALYSTLRAMESVSKAPYNQIHEISTSLSHPEQAMMLPIVGSAVVADEDVASVEGCAYFCGGKLKGMLMPDQTFYWSLMSDMVKGGIINVDYSDESDTVQDVDRVALEIKKNKTTVKSSYQNGKISMAVEIKTDVTIGEVETDADLFSETGLKKFTQAAQKSVESHCLDLVREIQKDGGPDIFHFGTVVKRQMPAVWKSIEDDWDQLFAQIDVSVTSKLYIVHIGEETMSIERRAPSAPDNAHK